MRMIAINLFFLLYSNHTIAVNHLSFFNKHVVDLTGVFSRSAPPPQRADYDCSSTFHAALDWDKEGHLTYDFMISPNSSPFVNYTLDFGDGSDPVFIPDHTSYPAVKHTYATGGLYKVCMLSKNPLTGCMTTYCKEISVTTCHADFTYKVDVATTTYTFFPKVNSMATTYHWVFYNGTATTSTLVNPSFQATPGKTFWAVLWMGSPDDPNCHDSVGVQIAVTGIRELSAQPVFLENYPNPFYSSTTIRYTISTNAVVEVSVLDLVGNTLAVIESGSKAAGEHVIEWDASHVERGMYLLQLRIGEQRLTKKMIIDN